MDEMRELTGGQSTIAIDSPWAGRGLILPRTYRGRAAWTFSASGALSRGNSSHDKNSTWKRSKPTGHFGPFFFRKRVSGNIDTSQRIEAREIAVLISTHPYQPTRRT